MFSLSKMLTAIAIATGALSTYPSATYAKDIPDYEHRLDVLERRVNLLTMNEVVYGPISVDRIHLNNAKHFAQVAPGQKIDCSFHYKLDSSQQEFLSKNHLIVGISGVAAEVCATHLYGVWNSSGTAKFSLIAPLKEGDYEVRIAYRPGDTCEDALNSWNVIGDEPSSFATIGILSVRQAPHP